MASYRVFMLLVVTIKGNPNLEKGLPTGRNADGNYSLFSMTSVTPSVNNQYTMVATPDCDNVTSNSLAEKDLSFVDQITTVASRVSIIDTGSMSKKTFQSFKSVARYLQFFLIGLGIVANICNIVVFTQQCMRSATSTILIFLSSSELGFAICELVVSSVATSMGSGAYTSRLYWTLIRWVRVYMTSVFQKNSFCFNLFVATERCIAVSFPLKANRILRRKKPVFFCALIFVVILSVHIFNPLKMDVVTITTGHGHIHVIRNSHLYKEYSEVFEGLTLAAKILFVYIPLFGCLVVNILMVVALNRHSRKRKALQLNQGQQQNDRREVQTTATILVSSLLFAIFSLPVTTFSIVQSLNPDYGSQKREHYLYTFVMYLSGMLALLSLSLDFTVYMILSRAFRQTFVNLANLACRAVCCFCRNRRSDMDIPRACVILENMDSSYSMATQQETDTIIE